LRAQTNHSEHDVVGRPQPDFFVGHQNSLPIRIGYGNILR
jgi:hypothetical protein